MRLYSNLPVTIILHKHKAGKQSIFLLKLKKKQTQKVQAITSLGLLAEAPTASGTELESSSPKERSKEQEESKKFNKKMYYMHILCLYTLHK